VWHRARHPRRRLRRPGGVYLDLPAKLFAQTMDAEAGRKSLIKVVDPAPKQIPGADASSAPSNCSRREKPLIVLAKAPPIPQADADIAPWSRRPASVSPHPWQGLLPDTHPAVRFRRPLIRAARGGTS